MRARRLRRTAALVAGGAAALAVAPIPLLTGPAAAATTAQLTLECQTATFPGFDWDVTVEASAVGDGSQVALTLEFGDLPGIAPVPIMKQEMTGSIEATIDGAAATLTGRENVTAEPNSPVPVPAVTGKVASSATEIAVVVGHVEFTVSGLTTACDPTAGADIGTVEVVEGVMPTDEPTTSPSPTTKPTQQPDKDDGGNKDAVPAKGKVTFACTLETLGSPFDYKPTVSVFGSRAKANDDAVSLWATMTDIPGLAPVPIENNPMKVTLDATVGDDDVTLKGSSTVNVGIKAPVPVPRLEASTKSSEDELDVEITGFKFDFGTISGAKFYSDCKLTGDGSIGTLTVGIGDSPDDGDDGDDEGNDDPATSPGDPGTLPKTGSGAPLTMVALWAGALTLLGAAAVTLLPKRRSEH